MIALGSSVNAGLGCCQLPRRHLTAGVRVKSSFAAKAVHGQGRRHRSSPGQLADDLYLRASCLLLQRLSRCASLHAEHRLRPNVACELHCIIWTKHSVLMSCLITVTFEPHRTPFAHSVCSEGTEGCWQRHCQFCQRQCCANPWNQGWGQRKQYLENQIAAYQACNLDPPHLG